MASRGERAYVVESATWTKDGGSALPLKGVSNARLRPIILFEDRSVRDGNSALAADDHLIVTTWDAVLIADVLAALVTGIATGDIGTLACVFTVAGGTNTKLNWSGTKLCAGILGEISASGEKRAPMEPIGFTRTFEHTAATVITGPTPAA